MLFISDMNTIFWLAYPGYGQTCLHGMYSHYLSEAHVRFALLAS